MYWEQVPPQSGRFESTSDNTYLDLAAKIRESSPKFQLILTQDILN